MAPSLERIERWKMVKTGQQECMKGRLSARASMVMGAEIVHLPPSTHRANGMSETCPRKPRRVTAFQLVEEIGVGNFFFGCALHRTSLVIEYSIFRSIFRLSTRI